MEHGGAQAAHVSSRSKTVKREILVIGGAGYIGSALLKRLLPTRRKVRLLDCLLYGTRPIQDLMASPNLEIVQADFRQVNEIVEAMQGVDEVIHLGGIVGDPACSIDEDVTVEVNLTATPYHRRDRQGFRGRAVHLRQHLQRLRLQRRSPRRAGSAQPGFALRPQQAGIRTGTARHG